MEQFAEQITESLIQQLPKEADFFTPQELLSYGISSVVVETLRRNVVSTIESGMNLPATDWVQTDSEKVLAAWNAFVDVSKQHIRIPASRISNLLEEAVEQCLELALKPRQSVPEIIFKTRKTIDPETAKLRVAALVVNQQLGLALLRYMEKKEKPELSLDEARELIRKVDEKLVENYHPLNWAQSLKPVFELAGSAVHSELFRMYFEDKEKLGIARKFDLLEKDLNETEFIEFMSSADLLDVDDFEDSQSELFVTDEEIPTQAEDEEEDSFEEESVELDEEKVNPEFLEDDEPPFDLEDENEPEEQPVFEDKIFEEADEEEQETIQQDYPPEDEELEDGKPEIEESEDLDLEDEKTQKEENIVNLFSQITKEEDDGDLYYLEKEEESRLSLVEPEEEDDDDNITLLNKFMFDESVSDNDEDFEDESENEIRPKKEPSSIYDEMNLVKENHQRNERAPEVFDEISDEEDAGDEEDESDEGLSYKIETREEEDEDALEESQPVENEAEEPDAESEEDLPMWRSFLERDDLETDSGYEYEDEDDDEEEFEDEEEFIEEPIYDLTVSEPDPEEKLRDISKWMDDEKDRFIEEIFRSSEVAYEQALIEILDFDSWKSASHYLEREVFSRNRIDVYDEAAVDFTDRLHSYFMENKS